LNAAIVDYLIFAFSMTAGQFERALLDFNTNTHRTPFIVRSLHMIVSAYNVNA